MTGEGPAQFGIKSEAGIGDIGRAKRGVRVKSEAALRMMTGAAAPDTEVSRYADFFTPKWYDRKETAEQKLKALDDFSAGAREYMLKGRTGTADFDPLAKSGTEGSPAAPKAQPSPAQQQLFEQHKNEPGFMEEWNKRFGQ